MQDKFYTIKPAVDTDETGHVFPAVESFDDYDFKGEKSVHKMDHWSIPNFNPDIRFKLAKGAKLCDAMGQATISGSGLLISERFKNILEKYNLGEHKFFDGHIYDNDFRYKYYWLHIIWNNRNKIVDYKQSSFFKKRGRRNLEELDINSNEEYDEVKTEFGSRFIIGFHKLALKNTPDYDLWPVPFRGHLIVSHQLKNEIENIALTGLDISENDVLFIPRLQA